jgi:hypothetical protein
MRKLTMLVGLLTIFSLALAGPALAALVHELGPGDNTYNERHCPPDGDERVFGRGGDDVLRLQLCGDTDNEPEASDSDADRGFGNRGNDRVRVDDGDIQDSAAGGRGRHDRCVGDRDLGSDNTVGDPPPAGGPDEDISDNLDESCERIIWVDGDFYNQT